MSFDEILVARDTGGDSHGVAHELVEAATSVSGDSVATLPGETASVVRSTAHRVARATRWIQHLAKHHDSNSANLHDTSVIANERNDAEYSLAPSDVVALDAHRRPHATGGTVHSSLAVLVDTCGAQATLAALVSVLQTLQTSTTTRPHHSESMLGLAVPVLHVLLYGTDPQQPPHHSEPTWTRTIWSCGHDSSPDHHPAAAAPSWILSHLMALPGLVVGAMRHGGVMPCSGWDCPSYRNLGRIVTAPSAYHRTLVTCMAVAAAGMDATLGSRLVTSLVRRDAGDAHVIGGLYAYAQQQQQQHSTTPRCKPTTDRVTLARVLERTVLACATHTVVRLYRAWLHHQSQCPTPPRDREWLAAWHPILQRHSHAICQLVVFSPCQSHDAARLCPLLVRLLSRTTECTHSDSDDSDSEDDGSRLVRDELPHLGASKRLLYHHVCRVAETWATTAVVRRWDTCRQQHVTSFLLAGLDELQSPHDVEFFPQSLLVARLMQGVTMRLGTTNNDAVRRCGMQVGEQLAILLGLDLKFEELARDSVKGERAAGDVAEPTAPTIAPPQTRRKVPKLRAKDWDPDAVYESSNEDDSHESDATSVASSDDDSEWDDLSSPYNLDDDMDDLRDVARPLYLSECLDYLRTPETDEKVYSRHEAALRELSRLVRLRPADLIDLGPELARSVLRLENKFSMERFTEMVTESLCSLTVADPVAVGLNLIAELFQDSTLSDRLLVLRTLEVSAWELSGIDVYATTGSMDSSLLKLPSARVSGRRALVSSDRTDLMQEAGGRTRRWGKGSNEYTGQKPLDDQFGRVAPVWFYSILSNFLERKDDAVLWGEEVGATLLSNVFLTLGRIVWHTGPHAPGVDLLAKDLFEVVWPFRNAEIAAVRNSVLCATGMVIGSLHQDTILSLLRDDTENGLTRNLLLMAEADPDGDCRSAAQAIAHSVRSTLNTALLL